LIFFSELPNKILPEPTEVCLIVKDLEKGLKVDHEPTTAHFRDLLNEKGLGPDVISTVMPLRELKVEYKAFETKTALCHKFDLFLADDRIIKFIPQFLGKPFYKRKKFPVAVSCFSFLFHVSILSDSHHPCFYAILFL
jgi:ribosome biogenesis protein UTP30